MDFPVCLNCIYFFREISFVPVFKCAAFPERIPKDISSGKNKHKKIIEGQVGEYTFQERSRKG